MFTNSKISNQLILIVAILVFTSKFSSSCLTRCFCKQTKITCENVDVSIDNLKELQISSEITEFYLRGSNLNKISSKILKKLKHLKTLEISNNNIEYIPTNTFKDFNSLEKLILKGNELKTLSKDMFTGLKNLYYLDLSENQISELSYNVFEKLPKIVDIRLQQNKLKVIPNFVFSNIKTLRLLFFTNNFIHEIHDQAFENLSMMKLGLSFNRLKSIPVSAFKGFQITGKIVLINNPLDCSCPFAMKYGLNLQHLQHKVWGYCANPFSVRESNILDAHKKMFCSMCDLQPCLNKGECIGNKTTYICKCGVQYKGDNCELDMCRNFNKNTPKTTIKDKINEKLDGSYRGSYQTENQSVINHTEYIYIKEKIEDKDSQTKLIILSTTCAIEFLIILVSSAYIGCKCYKEWKEEKEYNLKKNPHILFGVKNETDAKLSKALYDSDYTDYGLSGHMNKLMMHEDTQGGGRLNELIIGGADDSVPL